MDIFTEFAEEQKFKATTAIILYEASNCKCYQAATVHKIEHNNRGKASCKPGTPLDIRAIKELAEHIEDEQPVTSGWTIQNPRILARKPGAIIWSRPAAAADLHWKTKHVEELDKADGKPVILPALIFKVESGKMYVFAAKSNKITLKTALYLLPFFNVSGEGRVCMPNPKDTRATPDNIANWEEVFFESPFTHLAGAGGSEALWIDAVRNGKFPTSKLINKHSSIEDLLK